MDIPVYWSNPLCNHTVKIKPYGDSSVTIEHKPILPRGSSSPLHSLTRYQGDAMAIIDEGTEHNLFIKGLNDYVCCSAVYRCTNSRENW